MSRSSRSAEPAQACCASLFWQGMWLRSESAAYPTDQQCAIGATCGRRPRKGSFSECGAAAAQGSWTEMNLDRHLNYVLAACMASGT